MEFKLQGTRQLKSCGADEFCIIEAEEEEIDSDMEEQAQRNRAKAEMLTKGYEMKSSK